MTDAGHKFTHTYFAQYHDCDTRQRLTALAMMRYFEDIALLQSDSYEVGLTYYATEQVAWLLNKWDIRIQRAPVFKDDVHVLTQPMAMRRFLANRRYEISNEQGEILVEADSQWVFVDLARRRPTRIREDIFRTYGITDEVDALPTPPLPREPERGDVMREFHVRKSDIDVNRHVNNIRYVDWALDALPEEIALNATLRRLLIHYKKEVHYGEEVVARTEMRDEEGLAVACHGIYVGEELRCALESRWEVE
ncbi:MAG: acyl-ACP thioesterase domain-containing protein [Bacteroidota bacterium]